MKLSELEALYEQTTPGEWWATDRGSHPNAALIIALHNAFPELAQWVRDARRMLSYLGMYAPEADVGAITDLLSRMEVE